ncbi:MAG: nitroreductase family protein, partial [Actinobacteria bacterium]|nr:nitroreductase family protein [Actinomycetota bacterium]
FSQEFAENLGNAPVVIVLTMPETTNQNVKKYQLIACGAAIENFYLAATAQGLATVCLSSAAFVEAEILEYLGVTGEEVVTVLPLGYPDGAAIPTTRRDKSVFL